MTTSSPRASNAMATDEPTKPAPPVTRTFFFIAWGLMAKALRSGELTSPNKPLLFAVLVVGDEDSLSFVVNREGIRRIHVLLFIMAEDVVGNAFIVG